MGDITATHAEAKALEALFEDLRAHTLLAYAHALREILPNATGLAWSSDTQYDDSRYYAAIEDITLHIGSRRLDFGTLSQAEDFPTYWDEWIDFEPETSDEDHASQEGQPASSDADDPRFAAHLVATWGMAEGADWKQLGPLIAAMVNVAPASSTRIDFTLPPRLVSPHRDGIKALVGKAAPNFAATSMP